MRIVCVIVGVTAILAMLGIFRPLPDPLAVLLTSLSVLIFPGIILSSLITSHEEDQPSFPERLAVWFVLGISLWALVAFAGLVVRAKLHHLIMLMCAGYAVLAILVLLKIIGLRTGTYAASADRRISGVHIAIMVFAVALALVTLVTPRNSDDWYYLAHIRDYESGKALRSEDAIFNTGSPASPRTWYAGWWVLEAALSRMSGVHPVACHQVYLPLLIVFTGILGMYALAKEVFRSEITALLACTFQALFFLSSIFPVNNVGWVFFCRTTQDKAVAFALMVAVGTTLGLKVIRRKANFTRGGSLGCYLAYCLVLVSSATIHPLGPAWCGLAIVPFGLVELFRRGEKHSVRTLVFLILPFIVCGVILISGRSAVLETLESSQYIAQRRLQDWSPLSVYLPGTPFPEGRGALSKTLLIGESLWISNPSYILRFPLAVTGLVLTAFLFPILRRCRAARFLLTFTLAILFAAFTPVGTFILGKIITPKMVIRLCWVLPWGLTIGFFMSKLRLRRLASWTIVLLLALALARGNPFNYLKNAYNRRDRARPTPEQIEAFKALGSQASPQGVVLGSPAVLMMLASFVPDAYPATYRDTGPVDREIVMRLVGQQELGGNVLDHIVAHDISYLLLGNGLPLAKALDDAAPGFTLIHRNDSYSLWKVASQDD